MGSARVTNLKPIPMENTDKKSMKTFFKSLLPKKKEKQKIEKKETIKEKQETKKEKSETKKEKPETKKEKSDSKKDAKPIQNPNTVAAILENFSKINLQEKKQEITENADPELDNFTITVIEEPRIERIHSHTSEDSGFAETKEVENQEKTEDEDKTENDDKCEKNEEGDDFSENKLENTEPADELTEGLEKLGLDDSDKDCKKKKKQVVYILRAPMKNRSNYASSVLPYPSQEQDSYSKINQINKHTLSGGQVLVNQSQSDNSEVEVDLALKSIEKTSQDLQHDPERHLQDVMEIIQKETNIQSGPQLVVTPDYDCQEQTNLPFSVEYETTMQHDDFMRFLQESVPNSIEGLVQETPRYSNVQLESPYSSNDGYIGAFPTPPRSETVPSPFAASPGSFYSNPTNSEYGLSPGRSPISNGDFNERYQDIVHFEEEREATDKNARERTVSSSSMTKKQFKDMQKEIAKNFSAMDCCNLTRKSCTELFQEHLQKVKIAVRKDLCVQVSKLDLNQAFGVLHHILISLMTSSDKEDIQIGLFGLVCDRVLGQNPALFLGKTGLDLLKSGALRCPHHPLLTRYLVQCIRTAIKFDASLVTNTDHIFHEVDALGDHLVLACARAGDRCAGVLAELVRAHTSQPPLFKHSHTNADGYTALHVACSQHRADNPRLHTVHVLLNHADCDITVGDLKGGDTAVHMAVNSAHCDLRLVLLMFNKVPLNEWKALAHRPNLSHKTPLDLARLATKATTRQKYPQEVLDFLKKCR